MSSDSDSSPSDEQSVALLLRRNSNAAMEARAEHLKTRNYRTIYSIATALGLGLVVMVISWVAKHRGGFSWTSHPDLQFNWHPVLMTTSMVFIYGQSILAYRTGRNNSKRSLKLLHAFMNGLAFVLSVIGLQAVFDSHNLAQPPIPNLYSFHSWLGLIAVITFTAQFVFGFVSFLYPGLSLTLRECFMPVHRAVGTGTFVLALLAAVTGLTEKTIWSLGKNYSSLPSEGVLVNFIALFIALFGILVLYLVNDPDFKRLNLPDDQVALSNTND